MKETLSCIKHDLYIPVSLRAPAMSTGSLHHTLKDSKKANWLFENYASTDLTHSSSTIVNVQLESPVSTLLKEQNFFAVFSKTLTVNFTERSSNPKSECYLFQSAN